MPHERRCGLWTSATLPRRRPHGFRTTLLMLHPTKHFNGTSAAEAEAPGQTFRRDCWPCARITGATTSQRAASTMKQTSFPSRTACRQCTAHLGSLHRCAEIAARQFPQNAPKRCVLQLRVTKEDATFRQPARRGDDRSRISLRAPKKASCMDASGCVHLCNGHKHYHSRPERQGETSAGERDEEYT